MDSEVSTLIITNEGGVPLYFMQNEELTQADDNEILISGFVTAFSNFLSSVLLSEKEIIQFAQLDYEGIIDKLESGYYYTIIGKNLFKYSPLIYDQFFLFLDKFYANSLQNSLGSNLDEESEKLKQLISEIIESDSNYELFVPKKTDKEPFLWSAHAKTIFPHIDGTKNIKELSVSSEIDEGETFAILKILEWQEAVVLNIELRDYLIFGKTGQAYTLNESQQLRDIKEYFPDALRVLRTINGIYSLGQLKKMLAEVDVEMNLTILIEKRLIKTISNEQTLNILLYEYLKLIYTSFMEYFSEKEELLKELYLETSISMANLIDLEHFDLHCIIKVNNTFYEMGYTFDGVLANFIQLIESIYNKLSSVSTQKTVQLFGLVYSRLIEKHGFTLERMDLLTRLCPEKYI